MLCSILLILLNCVFWTRRTRSATATFSAANTGIDGWVTIDNRIVSVYLNLRSLDYSKLPSVDCLVDGLKFHVHEKWTYSDSIDRIGSKECSSNYTGDHYDPTLACGPSTGNPYCMSYTGTTNSSHQCVKSSSAFTTKNIYECNSTNYLLNPYVCEAGDLSGKYGELYLHSNITSGNFSSFWELMSEDVEYKSIVFHCGNNDMRAFCAPFNLTNEEYDLDDLEYNITDDDMYVAAVFKHMGGTVLNESFIAFEKDGDYIGAFDFSGEGSNCSSITYRIYDQWDSTETSLVGDSCSAVVGKVWDPTVTCLNNTDSPFCDSNCQLCNDTSYQYSCNFTMDRYSCSPSDLSGKYGMIELTNKITKHNNYSGMVFSLREVMERVFVINGTDDFAPPFELLYNKSIVIECDNYTRKIACAKIVSNMTEVMKLYHNFTIPNVNSTYETVKPTGTSSSTSTSNSTSTTKGMASTISASSIFTTPKITATTPKVTITTPKVTITTTKSQASSNGVYYFTAFCVMISMLVLQF